MSRPRKSTDLMTRVVAFRLDDREQSLIQRAASKLGLNRSDFLRIATSAKADGVSFSERLDSFRQSMVARIRSLSPSPKVRRERLKAYFIEKVDRAEVLLRSGGICGICGRLVDQNNFEVDHIVPIAKGGEHSYRNTQAAHPRCNNKKSDLITGGGYAVSATI